MANHAWAWTLGIAAAALLATAPAGATPATVSVQIGTGYGAPGYATVVPGYAAGVPVAAPAWRAPGYYEVYQAPYPYAGHRGHRMRDRDRDGIPDRFDRDRDGDGVPNRYDRRPGNPYRY